MKKLFKYERSQLFPDPDATLAILRNLNQPEEPPHIHDFVELVVVLAGTALHRVGSLRYRLEVGDVFVINPKRSHGYDQPENFHIANILIREDFFQKIHPSMGSLPRYHALFRLEATSLDGSHFESRTRLDGEDFKQALRWIEALEIEASGKEVSGFALAEAYLILLIGLICRSREKKSTAKESNSTQIGRLLSWIEMQAEQPIRMEQMAKVAAMSERTLLRQFHKATGETPLSHLIRVRLRKAQRLLENPSLNLTNDEVAWRCGFENGNYLARQFKKRFGVSPREWQKSRASWSSFK